MERIAIANGIKLECGVVVNEHLISLPVLPRLCLGINDVATERGSRKRRPLHKKVSLLLFLLYTTTPFVAVPRTYKTPSCQLGSLCPITLSPTNRQNAFHCFRYLQNHVRRLHHFRSLLLRMLTARSSLAVILPPLGVFLERGCGSTTQNLSRSHTTC